MYLFELGNIEGDIDNLADGDTLNIEGITMNPENLTTYIWKSLFSKFR